MGKNLRLPQAERREQVAHAALAILGDRGLAGLTTTALAEAIGVTSGALFRHFASREEMLEETVRVAASRVEATFPDPELPAPERLRALALARVRLISEEPGIAWMLRSNQAQQALPPAAVKRLRRLVRRSRAYIQQALEEAIETGDVRADLAPDMLLLVFTATVHALIGKRGVAGGRTRRSKPEQAIDDLLTLLAPSTPQDRS